ncbi:hypothetical protein KIN20_038390 [Parelaphostrongylus tenuis]|uniref:Uncharacterized protein n=1 Tax=Parelaphostrongylus tenuis TaxID=148309 RepID=A0AAD5MR85_PARTN|nr:hypothetical protein KIN20_038390 [Parelaphostrongylus tenuis]
MLLLLFGSLMMFETYPRELSGEQKSDPGRDLKQRFTRIGGACYHYTTKAPFRYLRSDMFCFSMGETRVQLPAKIFILPITLLNNSPEVQLLGDVQNSDTSGRSRTHASPFPTGQRTFLDII